MDKCRHGGTSQIWFTGTSSKCHFSKSCRLAYEFSRAILFLKLASGMPSNALLLCSILTENHCWIGIAMRQRKQFHCQWKLPSLWLLISSYHSSPSPSLLFSFLLFSRCWNVLHCYFFCLLVFLVVVVAVVLVLPVIVIAVTVVLLVPCGCS